MASMKEVAHPLFAAVVGLTLSKLVLVVRETKILTTEVNIELSADDIRSHGGALDMPARTARAPLGFPEGFTSLGTLPESKVSRAFLLTLICLSTKLTIVLSSSRSSSRVGSLRNATSSGSRSSVSSICGIGLQATVTVVRVVLEGNSVKVNRTVGNISKTVLNDAIDEINDTIDVLCHTSESLRRAAVESLHILEELSLVFGSMLPANLNHALDLGAITLIEEQAESFSCARLVLKLLKGLGSSDGSNGIVSELLVLGDQVTKRFSLTLLDLLGGCCGRIGKASDLVCNNRKSSSCFTRTGCFYGSV